MPKKKTDKRYFYLVSGRKEPVFLVDEEGNPAAFDSAEEARDSAYKTPMCMGIGFIIIEMSDTGPVGEAT